MTDRPVFTGRPGQYLGGPNSADFTGLDPRKPEDQKKLGELLTGAAAPSIKVRWVFKLDGQDRPVQVCDKEGDNPQKGDIVRIKRFEYLIKEMVVENIIEGLTDMVYTIEKWTGI